MSAHKTRIAECIVETVKEGGDVDEVLELIEQADREPVELHEDTMGVSPEVYDPIPGFATMEDYIWWLRQQNDEFWERQTDRG